MRTRIRGGMIMMGELLKTRLKAVSATASVAAFLLLPRLVSSPAVLPSSGLERTGNTSMPVRISSPRIRKTLRKPALATAAKGTRRPRIRRVEGDTRLRRGTTLFSPTATEHDAPTARTYDWAILDHERGDDLL